MAVRDALLALLATEPKHGYQLKAEFDEATGSAWPLNVGQVYTTLQRLERDGLVESDGDPDDDGRVPYRLTSAGHDDVIAWMGAAVEAPIASRDEVSMKVLLAVATSVAPPLGVLRSQRIASMSSLQALTALRLEAAADDLAWRLHLDRLVLLAEAELRWLDLAEERLRAAGHDETIDRRTATYRPESATT